MKKSQKGFTLVELVVVIAIIGVLAAILVPSMLNYVKKSRLKTANSNAKTAYNALAENFADAETQGFPLSTVFNVTETPAPASPEDAYKVTPKAIYEASKANAIADGGAKKVADALAENGNEAGCFAVVGGITNGKKTYVLFWAKTKGDEMVGRYPDAVQWDTWQKLNKGETVNGVSGTQKLAADGTSNTTAIPATYGVTSGWTDGWTEAEKK